MTNSIEEDFERKFAEIRPDHPDLDQLCRVIKSYTDSLANEGDNEAIYMMYLNGICDIESLGYAAIQRAITLAGPNPNMLNLLSAMWMEGFITCILFQQEPFLPDPTEPPLDSEEPPVD